MFQTASSAELAVATVIREADHTKTDCPERVCPERPKFGDATFEETLRECRFALLQARECF